ncbi:hypothetical protein R3W88_026835 [Solanum pinnatisectum]|uniref:Gag-pol polyprotein n=1 Tax=Solanum pinnatisectum TaxID=50273 RepID=A0AAV9LED1_9SOLN|nr:hypothetical protein R3W88_026835 [Solanum pinnatisectum]
MSAHEYSLKFTQLSRYAPKMVSDMRSRISLFVTGLCRQSSKEGKATMLIGDMDLTRLMIHVQQVEKDKINDREEFKNKKPPACAKCGRNHSGICREGSTGYFKCGQTRHFMRECPKNKHGNGNRVNRAQSSSVAPPDKAAPRGATSRTGGGTNLLYAINSHQE